jgi:hypothetical protein
VFLHFSEKTRFYETACHAGDFGIVNILRGARIVEARAAKAAGKKGKQ